MMTPRARVLTALAGGMPDRVPFVIWNNKLPNDTITRQLLELEACIVTKSTVYERTTPGIEVETQELEPVDGFSRYRRIFHTPAGDLSTEERVVPGTVWYEKMLFTDPREYDALEALISSKAYTPCFDRYLADDTKYGEQSLGRPETIYTPIQDLICLYMGMEAFFMEWSGRRRDRLMKLCEVVAEDRRKRLSVVADSPAHYAVVEANVVAEVTGPERFAKYHVPYIEEACELLHARGKYAAGHFDANSRLLADSIAGTSLDLIESFTPPPECDLPLAEARRVWSEKAIEMNFPSSIHLGGPKRVRQVAGELLREAAPGDRFIFGLCENICGGGADTIVPLARAVFDGGLTPVTAN